MALKKKDKAVLIRNGLSNLELFKRWTKKIIHHRVKMSRKIRFLLTSQSTSLLTYQVLNQNPQNYSSTQRWLLSQ